MNNRFFDISHDMLCVASSDGRFTAVNGSWTRALGWTNGQLKSKPFVEFVHPADRERTLAAAATLSEGVPTVDFRNRYQHADGGYRWIDWRATLDVATGEIYAAARDVTREVMLLEELVAREEMLTAMVAQQLRTRDDERRRIAGDLHDSSLQHVVAALMFLDAIPVDDDNVAEPAGLVRRELANALRATREVMQGLDPLELGEMSLDHAARAIGGDIQERFGLPVAMASNVVAPISHISGAVLCRMIREALVNAVKHASATALSVTIGSDATSAWSCVTDNGQGMLAKDKGDESAGGMGLGLAFLRERATSLGGMLDVTSNEANGTTIRMTIPREIAPHLELDSTYEFVEALDVAG